MLYRLVAGFQYWYLMVPTSRPVGTCKDISWVCLALILLLVRMYRYLYHSCMQYGCNWECLQRRSPTVSHFATVMPVSTVDLLDLYTVDPIVQWCSSGRRFGGDRAASGAKQATRCYRAVLLLWTLICHAESEKSGAVIA